MKEIPILFSTPMVQAILEGRKSQTRRLMKPQIKDCDHSRYTEADWKDKPTEWSEAALKIGRAYCGMCGNGVEYSKDYGGIKCPYSKPGDLLWVRETWSPDLAGDGENGYVEYIKYAADGTRLPVSWVKDYDGFKNRPGIHMNKEYARIWLQVTDIRVERLREISEEDAKVEGAEGLLCQYTDGSGQCYTSWVEGFKKIWKEINGPESWEANPWVWTISFKVLSTTGKPK